MAAESVLVRPDGVRIAWAKTTASCRREVSRELLRDLISPTMGEISFQQQCPFCAERDHGPIVVQLPGAGPATSMAAPLVSVSYAGQFAIAAVAPPEPSAFAIDAEIDSDRTRAAVKEALGPDTPDHSIRAWTRLEAVAKARQTGLRGEWTVPDTTDFDITELQLPDTSPPVIVSIARRRRVR